MELRISRSTSTSLGNAWPRPSTSAMPGCYRHDVKERSSVTAKTAVFCSAHTAPNQPHKEITKVFLAHQFELEHGINLEFWAVIPHPDVVSIGIASTSTARLKHYAVSIVHHTQMVAGASLVLWPPRDSPLCEFRAEDRCACAKHQSVGGLDSWQTC